MAGGLPRIGSNHTISATSPKSPFLLDATTEGKRTYEQNSGLLLQGLLPLFFWLRLVGAAGCPEPGRRNHSSFLTSRLHSYTCTTTSSCIECNTRLDSQIKLQTTRVGAPGERSKITITSGMIGEVSVTSPTHTK